MALSGRSYTNQKHRYGFQGQEKDNELKGENNSFDKKFSKDNFSLLIAGPRGPICVLSGQP